jgi:leader peptidase (prepilin peptidase)/N-methyltransferase
MEIFDLLAEHHALFIALTFAYSLLIGSFLNVVIYRLPIMLEREWRKQAQEILSGSVESQQPSEPQQPAFNLVVPASACPKCNAPIRAWQNVPVISYLFLRGKCAKCQAPISPRYPIVELTTAVLSAVVAWKLGFTWYCGAALLMTWALVALSMIDFDHQLLPDQITLPLVWIGLLISIWATPGTPLAPDMRSSIIGGVAGYMSLWSIYWLFKLLTGKEGMGYGDFKLLAAFGTWLGWQPLLLIVLLSAFAGAVVGIGLIVLRGRDRNIPIPYGPYLAIAGWIAMLWGPDLIQGYLYFSGLDRG